MSHGQNAQKRRGDDFWSRRFPGAPPRCKYSKHLTHRHERHEGKAIERKALSENDEPDGMPVMNKQTLDYIITAALSLLPEQMDSLEARRMLKAIAYQESSLEHRRQVRGPARSYWQFELGGLLGPMRHTATAHHFARICDELDYQDVPPEVIHMAMADNDILACCAARLLLYTLPWPLPIEQDEGWKQYQEAWRPGKPHPERWAAAWWFAES